MMPIDLTKYSSHEATHLLSCAHAIGLRRREYSMRCIPLKETSSGRLKIVVFGERNWKHRDHLKQIKYVDKDRVRPIGETR